MCGIAGVYLFKDQPASPILLKKMTDAIAHRGPDGEGIWCEGVVGMGHRRLSIIDLSPLGHQPMVSKDGRYVIIFNGEVYNFQELRAELEAIGYAFHSKTDTEVVLNAMIAWGDEALLRFNGMFAFSFFDRRTKRMMLARDRYGIKPLYYTLTQKGLVFSSEIKGILASSYVQKDMDKEGLYEYLTFQNFFGKKTLFKNIFLLEAGSFIAFDGTSSSVMVKRYWDFNFFEENIALTEDECEEHLDFLFKQAVSRQLISDVDVGSYLSGGMDSGSITAIAARQCPHFQTFTCGFDLHSASGLELSYDERSTAEYMSYMFKTEHYEMVLKAGDMERCMKKLVWHLEEPRVGQSYPNYYAAHLASKFVKVCLSGAGGDEIFGGYPWRYYYGQDVKNHDEYIDHYYRYWKRLLPNTILTNLIQPIQKDVLGLKTRDIFKNVFQFDVHTPNTFEDYVNHSLYFEAKTFLHGLLMVDDKLSMAHSLEGRVPFLDNDLVDFAQKIPVRYKLGKEALGVSLDENIPGHKKALSFQKTKDGKRILRKMMERHLPKRVIDREKQGFSAPDASWFKGESIHYVKDVLCSQKARIYDYVDPSMTHSLLTDHFEGRVNRRLFIWSMLYLENFLEVFEI